MSTSQLVLPLVLLFLMFLFVFPVLSHFSSPSCYITHPCDCLPYPDVLHLRFSFSLSLPPLTSKSIYLTITAFLLLVSELSLPLM